MPITSKFLSTLLIGALALSASLPASAVEPSAPAQAEVEQLLSRLAASGCTFQRNGSWHSAGEAREHLSKKYKYLLDKKRLATAEDFVTLAASKSSVSGSPYAVKCAGQEQPSAVWMGTQLNQLRAQGTKPK